jgi:hypothetical protein
MFLVASHKPWLVLISFNDLAGSWMLLLFKSSKNDHRDDCILSQLLAT